MRLIEELKRRNVIRMAGLYFVGAWLITQVAGTVLPMFGAPDWPPRSVVVLLAIGFVPVLIFSWIYELTPDGIRRDAEVLRERSIGRETGRRIDRAIIVVLPRDRTRPGLCLGVRGSRRGDGIHRRHVGRSDRPAACATGDREGAGAGAG